MKICKKGTHSFSKKTALSLFSIVLTLIQWFDRFRFRPGPECPLLCHNSSPLLLLPLTTINRLASMHFSLLASFNHGMEDRCKRTRSIKLIPSVNFSLWMMWSVRHNNIWFVWWPLGLLTTTTSQYRAACSATVHSLLFPIHNCIQLSGISYIHTIHGTLWFMGSFSVTNGISYLLF